MRRLAASVPNLPSARLCTIGERRSALSTKVRDYPGNPPTFSHFGDGGRFALRSEVDEPHDSRLPGTWRAHGEHAARRYPAPGDRDAIWPRDGKSRGFKTQKNRPV